MTDKVQKIQVRNLNLGKILKKYPKETKLWSPLYGDLWLAGIDRNGNGTDGDLIICYKHKLDEGCNRCILEQESRDNLVYFWNDGSTGNEFYNSTSMCVLFPSYDNLDWETM